MPTTTARALARSSLLIAALLMLQPAVFAADAECVVPGPPAIPDGDTASETQMISARQRMKLFQEAADAYMSCIDARIAKGSQSERKLERWNKQREKVATSIQTTFDGYNNAVRIYKARVAANPPSAPAEQAAEPPAEPKKPSGEPEPSSSGGDIFIPE